MTLSPTSKVRSSVCRAVESLGGKPRGKLRKYLVGKRETRSGRRFAAMAQTHYFPEDEVHYVWDDELDPALTVAPGDTVVYHTREVSDGQITPDSTAYALNTLDWDRVYPLAGPVAIEGAEPGDVVEVEVLGLCRSEEHTSELQSLTN